MADMSALHGHLKNLKHQAMEMASTVLSLGAVLTEEANRLGREDEVSRLKTLYSSIRHQLDLAKRDEASASYSQSRVNLMLSVGGLVASGIIEMVSENKQASATTGRLLQSLADKQRSFGTVLVCVGPNGLPDDVRVVSISKLARESNRQEFEVVKELQERGCILFSDQAFSLLINRLIDDVREGRLCLPISRGKLSEITLSSQSKLRAKKME
ncbi:MAG: hypothetical protein HW414_875 [Dehalococcoidia bacterium]|nr:hypothetical protein [Dehalococcoidia bacterium]